MATAMNIDDYDLPEARDLLASFGSHRYGYAVTPNVDHIIRFHDDAHFRELYSDAAYVLLDSRFLAHILSLLRRQRLRVCLGSDLTTAMFKSVIKPLDQVIVVGGTAAQAAQLRQRFDLHSLHHIEPPMQLITNPAAIDWCVDQIEALSPFRFCFLAVGSPQQEIIAQKLKERDIARGLALCVGAAIDFMTGAERRAPLWMQHMGLEWLFRLVQRPGRMAKRYLVRGPRIFLLLPFLKLRLRVRAASPADPKISTSQATAVIADPRTLGPQQTLT
jgi:exopolysaccharide biosynthesis WecB/TagA/CpsF family protein